MVTKSERLRLLDVLIPQYAHNKAEMEDYTKICKRENLQIKDIMVDLALPSYETEGYKVTCSHSTREKIDEDMLLDILKQNGEYEDIIKTKEYIDFDALENAIYKNLIPEDVLLQFDKARELKDVVTLRVSKLKRKEEE